MSTLLEYLENRIKLSGNETITFDELAEWPKEEFEDAIAKKKLVQADDADGISCRQCPQGCYKEVEYRTKDGQPVGVFYCEEEDCAGLITVEMERLEQYKIIGEKKPIQPKAEEQKKTKKAKKKRATQKQMQARNETVSSVALTFKVEHERLPTVDDIMDKTEYTRQEIYATDAYDEGKIAKNNAKPTDEMTGSSIQSSEQFSNNSIEHTRADRRSEAEQAAVDALIAEQKEDDGSRFVK